MYANEIIHTCLNKKHSNKYYKIYKYIFAFKSEKQTKFPSFIFDIDCDLVLQFYMVAYSAASLIRNCIVCIYLRFY